VLRVRGWLFIVDVEAISAMFIGNANCVLVCLSIKHG